MLKNLCGSDQDEFARYRRDMIQVKYEAAKGGQTRMMNIDKIAKQIGMPTKTLTAAMQKQLSVPIHAAKHMIPGRVSVDQLEKAIDIIIREQVLCQKCNLPELGADDVCKSCGHEQKRVSQGKKKKRKEHKKEVTDESKEELKEDSTPPDVAFRMNRLYEQALKIPNNQKIIDALWDANTMTELDKIENEIKQLQVKS